MPDKPALEEFVALNASTLKELQDHYGVDFRVRSGNASIGRLLESAAAPVGMVAAYDRGFDRTNPGYDKFYDRDRAMLDPLDLVSQPAAGGGLVSAARVTTPRGGGG